MKKDYLWDKTGSDADIENLENSLRVFRFPASDAPEIKSNVVSFEKEKSRKVFPVFRAFAAGFIITFVFIGTWFIYYNSITEIVKSVESRDSVQNELSKNKKASNITAPEEVSTEDISEKEFKNAKSKVQKQNFRVQKLIYKPKTKRQKIQKNQILKLTAEEKEAYEKLMLALSITGSKLKIVKDKVQNLDEQTAINTENNIDTRKK